MVGGMGTTLFSVDFPQTPPQLLCLGTNSTKVFIKQKKLLQSMLDMDLTMRVKNKKIDGISLDHEQMRR